jgi:hypothetical protein
MTTLDRLDQPSATNIQSHPPNHTRQTRSVPAMSDQITTSESVTESEATSTDRRALLRKLALGGAGAAAGVVLLNNGTASAADGGNLLLGSDAAQTANNTTTTPTIIDNTPTTTPTSGPSALSVGGYVPPADSPFPAGVGGYGDPSLPNGVHGSTTAKNGLGVIAANLSPSAATATEKAPAALAVSATHGPQVKFVLQPTAVTGPTPGVHDPSELYVDKDGTLWFTVPAPTTADPDAVRFVKLAGMTTAGSYNPIDPQRAYDSRQPNYTEKGVMAPKTNRVISVADGHSANGTVTLADAVPAGATAVQINVTAANMTGPNFLSVTAGDVTSTETSLLNWSAGNVQIANSITVPVDATRQINVFCGDQTGSTDVIIDVFGYYL